MQKSSPTQPRFIFFGTRGIFSRVVLQHLLRQKQPIKAIAVPKESSRNWRLLSPPPAIQSQLLMVPSFVNKTIVEIGWGHAIPVWEADIQAKEVPIALQQISPTAILVACWPTRLPTRWLNWPTWGALNVHPSLLPHYRGPVPLFWQRRAGLVQSGVTIHYMSKRLDEGDILAQAAYPLPDGATGQELDQLAAQQGATLLNETIERLLNRMIISQAQPKGRHYDSWPTENAFRLPTTWAARHAYNFMQAANQWHTPFTITFPSGSLNLTLKLIRALSFSSSGTLEAPVIRDDHHVAIQFAPGILKAQLASN